MTTHNLTAIITGIILSIAATFISSCSNDTYTHQERLSADFEKQVGGDVDASHYWKAAVRINATVNTDRPATVRSFMTINGINYLTDEKYVSGQNTTVSLSVPQGKGNVVRIVANNGKVSRNTTITLTGSKYQSAEIDLNKRNDLTSGVYSASKSGFTTDVQFDPSSYALHDPDPRLYGNSVVGNSFYKEWNVADWNYVCDLAYPCNNPEEMGEVVDYELISHGKFNITIMCGYKSYIDPNILGYYYHTPGTYNDIIFVDLFDTHSYDFLDGNSLVQYQLNNQSKWYGLNFQISDNPGNDSKTHVLRQGDDIFNSLYISRNYRNQITNIRGLTVHVDVPEGKQFGFYLRQEKTNNAQQYENLVRLGIPAERLKTPFKGTNFSVKKFNVNGTHRSWYHDSGDWCFMGMEDIVDGGDFDDNDVMFGITAIPPGELPEIVDPDINVGDYEIFPWTIAYEDIYRDADFDFNDGIIRIVPDFENELACVTVLAAGIDEEVILHYQAPDGSDMILGELHEILGKQADKKVNTSSSFIEVPGVEIDCVPWPKGFTMDADAKRFTLEVVRGDCKGKCSDWLTLAEEAGRTPEAMLLPGNWLWPQEEYNINIAYPNFNFWAKDSNNMNYWTWHSNPYSSIIVNY